MANRIITALLIFAFVLPAAACGKSTLAEKREDMIRNQIMRRGITDSRILNAFREVPREKFALPDYADRSYDDLEIPMGKGQTLDRPYEDALMMDLLDLDPSDRVLEVGTGSGYLASLMSKLVKDVYTIEIEPKIYDIAVRNIAQLGYKNVHIKLGDGFLGWPEAAPFNAMVLTCSPPSIPEPLVEQLAEGGFLFLPLGGAEKFQEWILYEKKGGKFSVARHISPATFVPMKGKILEKDLK